MSSFTVTPESGRFSYRAGFQDFTITNRPAYGITYEIEYNEGSGWITVTDQGTVIRISVTANPGNARRTAVVNLIGREDPEAPEDSELPQDYVGIDIVQDGIGYEAIWKDIYYLPEDAHLGESYHYRICDRRDDSVLYEGVTVSADDDSYPYKINVPRLVESYISSGTFSGISSGWETLEGRLVVDFYKYYNDAVYFRSTFQFWNDWSDWRQNYNQSRVLNDPINGKGCQGMMIPLCVYSVDSEGYTAVITQGGQESTISLGYPGEDFGINTKEYTGEKVVFKKNNTEVFSYDLSHCGEGYLVYRNRFGGWDSFLLEGNISKTETYERERYKMPEQSSSARQEERKIDRLNINTSYTAYTGWLSDEESERLVFHLLSSPVVYFVPMNNDLYRDEYLIPVLITNSSSEYKKFRNGRKIFNYTITFEESYTKNVQR